MGESLLEIYKLDPEADGRIRRAVCEIGSVILEADYHTEVVEKLREMLATMPLDEFLITMAISFNALMRFAEAGYGEGLPPEVKNVN